MPAENGDVDDEVLEAQWNLIRTAAGRAGIEVEMVMDEGGGVLYQRAAQRILTRNDLDPDKDDGQRRVRRILDVVPGSSIIGRDERSVREITAISTGELTVTEALAQIHDVLRDEFAGTIATPDHIMSITSNGVSNCPATEPEPVPPHAPFPPPIMGSGGRGVSIYVPDRGLPRHPPDPAQYWLTGVQGEQDTAYTPGSPPVLGPYAAHGLFIAGVARCVAPEASITVTDAFRFAGADLESFVVGILTELIDSGARPDVISLSAGCQTWNDEPLLSVQVLLDNYLTEENAPATILVAAAGNNRTNRRFHPAAMEGVTGVGALAHDEQTAAWFSNYGKWVDVWTMGDRMVNAFATGLYTYNEPPNQGSTAVFDLLARWSGTSFSAPLFAGLVAARMSWSAQQGHPESSRDAAAALLKLAQQNVVVGAGPALSYAHVNQ